METFERVGDVAVLRIRGGKANALTLAVLDTLRRFVDEVEASNVGAAVVTGYDRYFSAGLPLPLLIDLDRPTMRRFMGTFNETMARLFGCPVPLAAAINGHAVAGGCVLALQADYRAMADGEFRIGLNEVQLGIGLPAIVLETLRAQVPAPSLLPIAQEGRLLSPREALALGLVHEVATGTVEEAALGWARRMAEAPREGVRSVKRALRQPALRAAGLDGKSTATAPEQQTEEWLDTWFSEAAQRRLRDVVARLSR